MDRAERDADEADVALSILCPHSDLVDEGLMSESEVTRRTDGFPGETVDRTERDADEADIVLTLF